jgi:hypothetical protein
MTVCQHVGTNYPRGNKYKGKCISQKNAASLTHEFQGKFRCNQVPSLLYDPSEKGFDPTKWRCFIPKTECARLFLLPSDGKNGNLFSNLVHVHRSNDCEENNFLYKITSKLIRERNPVRTTDGWDGVGIMVGVGEHVNWHGQHTDFVLKPKFRSRWSHEEEKLIMYKCGLIFAAQFQDKCVGYREMIQHQKEIFWPNKKCPSYVGVTPRCWNASQNLGNELHNDHDADRSFAVWTRKKKHLPAKSWYLLFPEWEVAIEIEDGTCLSWNGRTCGHCTAVPDVDDGDEYLSLFCSIPKKLRDHMIRNQKH